MTFESTPPSYSSVNDPLVYVAYDAHSASPSTYPDYKYVAEVWINGTQQFTGKYFPNPTTNRGIMDVGAVVREYVASTLEIAAGIKAAEYGEGEWSLSVVVKIREEYSGTVGAVVLTDSTRVYFNHYNGRINSFTKLGDYTAKPLTSRGTTINLRYSAKNYFIPYFSQTTSSFNVVITGGTSTRTKSITPSAANTLQLLNISVDAINTEYPGNFTTSTTSYTVAVGGTTYTINIICDGLYTNYHLHFMNAWGGYETMLFNKVSKKTFDIQRKSYQQLAYRVDGSGVVSIATGSIMHRQKKEYAGRYTEKLSLNTDWLSDTDYQWLADLVMSPQVYFEDQYGNIYPVVLSETNYQFKQHIVDGLINLMVTVEFGNNTKTQWQ
jgi:hypothetical protein